jgi:hypothetical protein
MKEGYDVMVKSENYSAFMDSKHKVPPSTRALVKARARLTSVGMTSYKKFTLTPKLL